MRSDAIGDREVAVDNAVVAEDSMRVEAGFFPSFVQKSAASGTRLAIDEADVLAGQIVDRANPLGIARRHDQPSSHRANVTTRKSPSGNALRI
jgi:hypothetical protein